MAETDYVCSLCAKTIKKAEKELNEDPKERLGAVEALREWGEREPWINIPKNPYFLLSFLRWGKFSQLKARERLTNFFHYYGRDPRYDYIRGTDPGDPKNLEIFRRGYCVMLPGKDKKGRSVILARPGGVDPDKYSQDDYARAMVPLFHAILFFLEEVQVNGLILLADAGGISMKLVTWWGVDKTKRLSSIMNNASPARMKTQHFFQVGTVFDAAFALFSPLFSSKIRKRVKVHKTLLPIYDVVDMSVLPDEYLPDDYDGPSAGSIDSIIEWNIQELFLHPERREFLKDLYTGKYYADLEKKSKDSETMASFRKLNVS